MNRILSFLSFCDVCSADGRSSGTHRRIRPSANPGAPAGRPDFLYFIPQSSNTRDYLTEVDVEEIDIAEELRAQESPLPGCSPYFNELAELIMEDEGLEMPNTAQEARDLS